MLLSRLKFLSGNENERLQMARVLAFQTPKTICKIFVELGLINEDDLVQVVIKEGENEVGDSKEHHIWGFYSIL